MNTIEQFFHNYGTFCPIVRWRYHLMFPYKFDARLIINCTSLRSGLCSEEHSTGSLCIYVSWGSIYVHRPSSTDLNLNSYVVWVIEAKLFNNPNDGDGIINLQKPNDIYICRTAALTSRRYILNIYSTNIHTEYFKHAA